MSQFHLPSIQGSPNRMNGQMSIPVQYGDMSTQIMPRSVSQTAGMGMMGLGGENNSYASFKLYEKMREEKIMAVLERQAEYLAKIATKFKIF